MRAVFSGHEHNFQHSSHGGIDYFVTGAGSKVRKGSPDRFEEAHTRSWSDHAHFLLVTVDHATLSVEPIGELIDGEIQPPPRFDRTARQSQTESSSNDERHPRCNLPAGELRRMAEVLVSFDQPVRDELGEYHARAVGRAADDGMWEGWIEFRPIDGSTEVS